MRHLKNLQLSTKEDYFSLFKRINTPLRQHYNGYSRIFFGTTGVGYGNRIAGMEGFSRMLWGAGPCIEQLGNDWLMEIKRGILAGTDPQSSDYWGDLHDRDQRMVEMPAIAFTLLHHNHYLWKQYTAKEQHQITTWLKQIFEHQCSDGNWQFFKILVYQVLKKLGVTVNTNDAKSAMEKIEHCYRKDGWYQDSARGRMDYYTPFAFQYYGILYSILVPDDPMSAVFKQRAKQFAKQYIHFFAEDGTNVPFGRSLTYRYAVVAFWAAMVYGDIWPEKINLMKGIINRNIRYWFDKPIFDSSNLLTLGYGYAQLSMTEPYNSPVSPYWANKIFLLLALPDDHKYWQVEEIPYPEVTHTKLLSAPNLLAIHDNGHTFFLNAGQPGPNYHALTNEKYFKFAYSSQFGFSIPRNNQLKEEAVMDSMLGIQTKDTTMVASRGGQNITEPGMFYTRNNVYDVTQSDNVIGSTWLINDAMNIRTWLTSIEGWQIRVHRLTLKCTSVVYETGFALENNPDNPGEIVSDLQESYFKGSAGFTGIVDLTPSKEQQVDATIQGFPNTNLITPEVVSLPGRLTTFTSGTHYLITGIYAHQDIAYASKKWLKKPVVDLQEHKVKISLDEAELYLNLK